MLQRLTLVKLVGSSAELIARQLRAWGRLRREQSDKPFPPGVRRKVDAVCLALRKHCAELPGALLRRVGGPVVHGRLGDEFANAFPKDIALPILEGDAFELYAYPLPDGGALEKHIAHRPLQGRAEEWLVARLKEAVACWTEAAPHSVLLLLREVMGGSLLDDDVKAHLRVVPDWVSDLCRDAL